MENVHYFLTHDNVTFDEMYMSEIRSGARSHKGDTKCYTCDNIRVDENLGEIRGKRETLDS